MRIIFMGTPDFAVPCLEKLAATDNEIVAVVTKMDKPVGRNAVLTPSPVKVMANKLGIKVLQFNKIRVEGVEDLKLLAPDLMVTCAFGQILSQEIIDIPKLGIINVHASLLPLYRGAAPIQWAVLNGEKETGISIMRTEAGIDTGDVMLQKRVPIGSEETSGELFDRLSFIGAECLLEAVEMLKNGSVKWLKQDESRATHVKMISKEDGRIDWNKSSYEIHNFVRGMSPWPSAYTDFCGNIIKIWRVEPINKGADAYKSEWDSEKCGAVLVADCKNGLTIKCGEGAVRVLELQAAGGKRLLAETYLLGNKIALGKTMI